jgi:hypothetical protein
MHAERLADQAAQAVARDGIADGAHADRHAEPGAAGLVGRALHREECVAMPFTPLARAFEVGGAVELVAGPQSVAP